jgi:FkbM family methyltransferase
LNQGQLLTSLRQTILKAAFAALPEGNDVLYRAARRVVDRYRGDNNFEMSDNGEGWLLERAIPQAAIVMDIGANCGEWTAAAARLNTTATFHCFEPSPTTFARLSERCVGLNAVLNNRGCGEVSGEGSLFIYGDGSGANSLYDRVGLSDSAKKQETVSITTVDEYCGVAGIGLVDFLKIDVEGHELAVLRGARRLLAEGRLGIVQFEYGGTYIDARTLLKDICEYVRSTNSAYDLYKLFPNHLQAVPEYRQSLETFQYSNWALLHRPQWQVVDGVPIPRRTA